MLPRAAIAAHPFGVGQDQLLLQGAKLKSTRFALGLAVGVGRDTKLALNQAPPPLKFSSVEKRLNYFLFFYFGFVLVLCTIATAFEAAEDDIQTMWYLTSTALQKR